MNKTLAGQELSHTAASFTVRVQVVVLNSVPMEIFQLNYLKRRKR